MAQMLVRGVDDATVKALKRRARTHGRSLSSEVRTILQKAAGETSDWKHEIEKVRLLFEGRTFSDSAELIREDRDR